MGREGQGSVAVGARRPSRPVVVDLDDPRAVDASLVGAKAAALARARAAHLPVLPGAVLTTAAPAPARSGVVDDLWARVATGASPSLVVRSSSTVEDGRRRSMAGQFRSIVGVGSRAELAQAIDDVLASARVVPLDGRPAAMAVLVQPEVGGGAGGVLFGIDPVSGRTDRLVLVANDGGPEAVVRGTDAGQQAWLGRRGRVRDGRSSLSARHRRALAALARRTAQLFGGPQDIEWAVDGQGTLHLLQSRPVTATGEIATGGPVLGPGPVAETFPRPLGPLEADLWVAPLDQALAEVLSLVGASPPRRPGAVVTTVGGWVAADLEVLGAATPRARSARDWLDPRRSGRRLLAAWRAGRLRAALPALATDVLHRADADLVGVGELARLPDGALLRLLDGARRRLVALHGHEVLMGWLVPAGATTATAASVALRLVREGRQQGLSDAEIVARHPTTLVLVPPTLGPASLPPVPDDVHVGGTPGGASDDPAVLREALRLRARWVQELGSQAAAELGRRLARRGVVAEPLLIRWLHLDELSRALETGLVPDDLAERAAAGFDPPLPTTFRLGRAGRPVALRPRGPSAGVGAGGGRGAGPVHQGDGPPPQGSVWVVQSLEPTMAPWLSRLGGLVAETGSPLSHLAILAREHGVPTVVGAASARERFPAGATVIVDGSTGEVAAGLDPRSWGAAS